VIGLGDAMTVRCGFAIVVGMVNLLLRSVRACLLLTLLLVAMATGQEGGGAADSVGSPDDIVRLVHQLSSSDYAEREEADARLRELGMPAVDFLAERFRDTDEFETRLRIQRIVEHVYFWDRVLGRNGFLGIQHRAYQDRSDDRIPPGTTAFEIRGIIEGTSADHAGLEEGDMILSVNGTRLPKDATANDFAALIRDKAPGTLLVLEVIRGRQTKTFNIKLGHRPAYYYGTRAPPEMNKQYADAIDEFPEWWREHFGDSEFEPLDTPDLRGQLRRTIEIPYEESPEGSRRR
jgi:PDZ domain